jgi:lipoate---protein ligase
MHGEFKTPGGKLVMVDFDVVKDRLSNVTVSGDFFLYPEETLETINAALEDIPVAASSAEMLERLSQAIPSDAELLGFSPEAVVTAIERGLL